MKEKQKSLENHHRICQYFLVNAVDTHQHVLLKYHQINMNFIIFPSKYCFVFQFTCLFTTYALAMLGLL